MSLIDGLEHIVRENEPLAPFTKLNLGGVAEFFAEPTSVDELAVLTKRFHDAEKSVRLIGGGSNIVVRDEGVSGLVVHLDAPAFNRIEVDGDCLIVGGGTRLSHFVATAVREGFAGPENLVGVPGTIGGALHGNSSAHGVGIGSWLASADVLTRSGAQSTRTRDSISFSYRQSSLNELAILSARFEFEREDPAVLTRQMQKLWIVRRASQPLSDEYAAFVFKDHGGDSAAQLIDDSGLKGTKVGNVEISDRNSNYFVAHSGATSKDFIRLMDLVKSRVLETLGIELEPVVQIW